MKSSNFSDKSSELIDSLDTYIEYGSNNYLNISYKEIRFRVNRDTDINSLKQMISLSGYDDNDMCLICTFVLDSICMENYLDPIVDINDEITIVGGSILKSKKAGDLKLEQISEFWEEVTEEEITEEYIDELLDEESRKYVERLYEFLNIAVSDKYAFLIDLVKLIELEIDDYEAEI